MLQKADIRKTSVSVTNETQWIVNSRIYLNEVCGQSTLSISGYTETTNETPASGQFKVEYFTDSYGRTVGGLVLFHSSADRQTVTCAYTGYGSMVWAYDWNKLPGGYVVPKTATFDLLNTEKGACFVCNSSAAIDVVIYSELYIPMEGAEFTFVRKGTGNVTIVPGNDVVLNSYNSFRSIKYQNEAVTLKRTAYNEWYLLGSLY